MISIKDVCRVSRVRKVGVSINFPSCLSYHGAAGLPALDELSAPASPSDSVCAMVSSTSCCQLPADMAIRSDALYP